MFSLVPLYFGIIGLFIGSFLNVLIDRLPAGKSVIWGRSACDYCGTRLSWYELIPVLSFLLQRGRCRSCSGKLSLAYPLSEVTTAVLFWVVAWNTYPNIPLLLTSVVIASCLLVITVIDFKQFIIPDSLTIIAFVVQFLYILVVIPEQLFPRLISAFGAVIALGCVWLITKGKGMGFGDVKFAGFLGLSLGFPAIVVGFYVAFLTGAALGIILIVGRKKSTKTKVAFGPLLIFGYIVALLYTRPIIGLFGY